MGTNTRGAATARWTGLPIAQLEALQAIGEACVGWVVDTGGCLFCDYDTARGTHEDWCIVGTFDVPKMVFCIPCDRDAAASAKGAA